MAQQSARRGRKNQMNPSCLEHAFMSLADLRSSRVQSVEGGYGATVGETGPEEPDVLIVPGARIYDLVPVSELPYGPAAPSLHQRPDRWQHPTKCQLSSKNRLHLVGRYTP
jgi:hypothetical protein